MDPNNSKNAAEDNLLDESDISSFSSAAGMDKNEMTGKIRKLEAELLQIKEANSNQFGGHSLVQLGIQIGEKFGEFKKEIDGLKAEMANMKEAFEGLKAAKDEEKSEFEGLKKEFEKMTGENDRLKENMAKMNEEFVGKNAELEKKMKEIEAKLEGGIAEKNGELKNLKEKMVKVEEELEGMKRENEDLKEKVGKLAEEIGEMKAAKDEENAKFEELKAAMAKIKEEFDQKNVEFEGKMRESLDQKANKEMLANLTGRIDEMGFFQLKNNKWNAADCGPKLDISEGGLVVKHSAGRDGWNCIRAISPILQFNSNATKPSVAAYFEVQIVHMNPIWVGGIRIQIGFCTKQFPLEGKWLGDKENSIGIWSKEGIYINGKFEKFGNNANGYFKMYDVIGFGIIHFPADKSMKCFAIWNGQFLGTIELPDKFASLELFPAINLFAKGDSIRAIFGQQKWLFNPSHLLQ